MSRPTLTLLIASLGFASAWSQSPDPEHVSRTAKALDTIADKVRTAVVSVEENLADQYQQLRKDFLEKNRELRLGPPHDSEVELVAQVKLDALRDELINRYRPPGARQKTHFPPAQAFPLVKDKIGETESFHWIRRMPKGGLLHTHSTSTGRARWVAENLHSFADCSVYWPPEGVRPNKPLGKIAFGDKLEQHFRMVKELHEEVPDFVDQMEKLLLIEPSDFTTSQLSDPWHEFNDVFSRMNGFITHQPAFRAYIQDAFASLVADGIDYVEMRTGMGTLSDGTGKTWQGMAFIDQYRQALHEFQETHPDFNMKLIIADYRGINPTSLDRQLQTAIDMYVHNRDIVVGFDLVGEETSANPTRDFIKVWMKYKSHPQVDSPEQIPLYFHDGETDWADNENVVDATLLGTKRIGHGFNLVAYPQVERKIKEKQIALEVCPISNQLLRYVRDLRLHPACGYVHRGVPCVLGSDDPLIFGNEGLSYDFWVAWMAWDLKLDDLKRFAFNSLHFSGMTDTEKETAKANWEKKWNAYVAELAAL